jgi:hypothetical protein
MVRDLKLRIPLAVLAAAASGFGFPILAVFAETNTEHNATDSFPEFNPCTGQAGIVTVTYNEIEHESSDNSGGSHETFTQTGTFVFEQEDGLTITGHFTIWDGENGNSGGTEVGTFTFSLHGTASDGTILRANSVAHYTSSPADIITSMFERTNCH